VRAPSICGDHARRIEAEGIIHQLIDKVRVGAPPADNVALYRQGATVMIRTKDGRTSTSTVYVPKGSGANGIAWTDIDAKYRALMPHARFNEAQVEASLALIHDLPGQTSIVALIGLLRPQST
jgi:2-methylcitrate dehydratase PrpD